MTENEMISEVIDVGMITYLGYIQRKIKKNSNFEPHPIVKAISLALMGAQKEGKDGYYMGISGDPKKGDVKYYNEAYIVVIKKEKENYKIEEIMDAVLGKKLSIFIGLIILKLSMKLDRFKSDLIPIEDAIKILNETVPNIKFRLFNNKEWIKARDHFIKLFKEGKIALPPSAQLTKILSNTKFDNSWNEYPPEVRSLIGMVWGLKIDPSGNTVTITSPDTKVEKHKIINLAKQMIFGKPSEFFKQGIKSSSSSYTHPS